MDVSGQAAKRQQWYTNVREHLHELFNPDGSGKIPQFNPPYREPIWILPALYSGQAQHVELANKIVARYNDAPTVGRKGEAGLHSGADFNIFQSNILAGILHVYGHLATPAARAVMEWHTRLVFRTRRGSRQSDFAFHGANDNMPMLATLGHIMGGEAIQDAQAVRHGVWMLNQFRRLLSRSAWASEYNSQTYSALTLSVAAKIANHSHDAGIRELARNIEHRLWAELILHYHPDSKQFAGPQSRAYMVDLAGHVHSLHLLFWLVFGNQAIGRDPLQSYFHPDGAEIIHFGGNHFQNIAEYCDFIEPDFHVPDELAELVTRRRYPAMLRGRSEAMYSCEQAAEILTTTYMEEEFSLGSSSRPWHAPQSSSLVATFKRCPEARTFRDSGVAYVRYLSGQIDYGAKERSIDGNFEGEKFVSNMGWSYTLQKDNAALLSMTPLLDNLADKTTDFLRLAVVFPAHFGGIRRSIIGEQAVREGAEGQSQEVACVSVETGEIYIHIRPLLPTVLPRKAAVRFVKQNAYELLELINYQGPERTFSRRELARVLNGLVITVVAKSKHHSLQAFHEQYSQGVVRDYWSHGHRFVHFERQDVEFELAYTTDPVGAQTEAIDGRHRPRPVFESNQIDVSRLPFMSGTVARNQPHFPWGDNLAQPPWTSHWLIGSRGLPGERPYSKPVEGSEPGVAR